MARIDEELDGIRLLVKFQGTIAEFRRFLRTDARFYPEERQGDRRQAHDEPAAHPGPRPEFFGRTPKAPSGRRAPGDRRSRAR
jgi:hypothetical protein